MGDATRVTLSAVGPLRCTMQEVYADQLPRVWIGYLLSLLTFLGEVYAVEQNPDLANGGAPIPLSIYLPAFVSLVYWLVCVHRYHVILGRVEGWGHPISPNRAVWFHFIPLYNFYWIARWPQAIAELVNWRLKSNEMKAWGVSVGILGSVICRIFVEAP